MIHPPSTTPSSKTPAKPSSQADTIERPEPDPSALSCAKSHSGIQDTRDTSTDDSASSSTAPGLKTRLKAIATQPAAIMLMSVFMFSIMVLCVKMASGYYTSFEIISFRGFVGAACLLLYQQIAHGHGLVSMKTSHFGMQVWRAFIGTMSMVLWFSGIAVLPLAMATTINYMSSIWIALFIVSAAIITGKNKPDIKMLLAILIGFAGIVVILRPSGSTDSNALWASLLVLLSSVFTALAYLQVAALGRVGEPEYRTVFYFCVFGAIFGLVATLFNKNGFSTFSWVGMAWMIPVGITAMVAQLLLTRAYSKGNPMVNASLQYLGLVFVTIFDVILGYGWPDAIAWIGMAMVVFSGLAATLLRVLRIPHLPKHADKHHH